METTAESARHARLRSIAWATTTIEETPRVDREEIAKMDYAELKGALQSGSVTALAALCSTLEKALLLHMKTNCVVLFLEDAANIAREWDRKAADAAFVKPPLFGIPFSDKESIPMKGRPNTRGGVHAIIAEEDHGLINAVRRGVPFALTNVPLSLMTYETTNGVFGTTTNPHRSDCSPGGSSGGEGAMIGGGAAHLGFGSDYGGSIRIPSSYCGNAGYKPTAQRLSLNSYQYDIPGRPFIGITDGPMSTTIQACVDVLKLTWSNRSEHHRDPYIPPVDWQEDLFCEGRNYTIGVMNHVADYITSSGQIRAIAMARKVLENAGHTVIDFNPPDLSKLVHLLQSMILTDGGAMYARWLDAELVPDVFKEMHRYFGMSADEKAKQADQFEKAGEHRAARLYRAIHRSPADVQQGMFDVYSFRNAFVKAMREQGIDAILGPTTLTPALRCGTPLQLLLDTVVPTFIYNLLDFGAGCIPMGKWTSEDTAGMVDYPETDNMERTLKRECLDADGLPLSVQVSVPPFRDEVALRILCDLETHAKGF